MNFDVIKVFEEKISGDKKNEERPILLEMIGYRNIIEPTQEFCEIPSSRTISS
jgi:hypothetical protein